MCQLLHYLQKSAAMNYIILILLKLVFRNMGKVDKSDNPTLGYYSNNANI